MIFGITVLVAMLFLNVWFLIYLIKSIRLDGKE